MNAIFPSADTSLLQPLLLYFAVSLHHMSFPSCILHGNSHDLSLCERIYHWDSSDRGTHYHRRGIASTPSEKIADIEAWVCPYGACMQAHWSSHSGVWSEIQSDGPLLGSLFLIDCLLTRMGILRA